MKATDGTANENREVRISFRLVLADSLAARRLILWKSRAGMLWLALSLLIVIVFAATGSASSAISYAVFILAFLAWGLYFRPRNSFRSSPALSGDQVWLFDPEGISCEVSSPEGRLLKTEIVWDTLIRVREGKALFLLSTTRDAATILPKRAFDASQLSAVRSLLFAERDQ
jgi:hypothetical protein